MLALIVTSLFACVDWGDDEAGGRRGFRRRRGRRFGVPMRCTPSLLCRWSGLFGSGIWRTTSFPLAGIHLQQLLYDIIHLNQFHHLSGSHILKITTLCLNACAGSWGLALCLTVPSGKDSSRALLRQRIWVQMTSEG